MNLPDDYTLPFFSYGLFQPGQIGYTGLRQFVEVSPEKNWTVKGRLLERDGLPLLANGSSDITGTLIRFTTGKEAHAYSVICRIEPDKLYKWATADACRGPTTQRVNLLHGLKPERGTHPPETYPWDGRNEPLFKDALEVVQDTCESNMKITSETDLKPLIRLQMAYLLLWTAIERYTSFRYHLGQDVSNKTDSLASDPVFAAALKEVVKHEGNKRELFRCDNPEDKETLDPANPKKAVRFYFQLRSNITHRGKAAFKDHKLLATSLKELLEIFRRVLKAEFDTHCPDRRNDAPA